MTGTFDVTTPAGTKFHFEAKYRAEMRRRRYDSDGWEWYSEEAEPTITEQDLVAYVNGERVDSCWNSAFWETIDIHDHPGIRKIWGLKLAFTDPEQAAAYDRWIADLKHRGSDDAVREYEAERKRKNREDRIRYLREFITDAEKQTDLPSRAEAKRRMKAYNDVVNEGGDGFVPYIVSREEYDNAVADLAKLEQEV